MRALFVKERTSDGATERIINLDNCEMIEFDYKDKALDFWLGQRGIVRFRLSGNVLEADVMRRLKQALSPLYEGRMNQLLGIKLELDLTGF